MGSVGDRGRELLEGYRSARSPTAPESDKLWDGVQARLVAGDDVELPEEPAANGSRRFIVGGVVAAAAVVAIVLSLDALRVLEIGPSERPVEATYSTPEDGTQVDHAQTRSSSSPAVPAVAPVDPALTPQPDAASAPVVDAPKPRRKRVRPRAEPTPPRPMTASQIREETTLYKRGQQALRDQDPRAALGIFEEHARKYPTGTLVEERKLQRMVALCRLGNAKQARIEASRFLRQHPRSPLRSHVRRVCTDDSGQ